jgi:hypothetical protein
VGDILIRVWEGLVGPIRGTMSFRLILSSRRSRFFSPSGTDEDRSPYFWTIFRFVPAGISEGRDEKYRKGVTPECFYPGVQSEFRLDSRLKLAGMTVFGKKFSLTQQAAGN